MTSVSSLALKWCLGGSCWCTVKIYRFISFCGLHNRIPVHSIFYRACFGCGHLEILSYFSSPFCFDVEPPVDCRARILPVSLHVSSVRPYAEARCMRLTLIHVCTSGHKSGSPGLWVPRRIPDSSMTPCWSLFRFKDNFNYGSEVQGWAQGLKATFVLRHLMNRAHERDGPLGTTGIGILGF